MKMSLGMFALLGLLSLIPASQVQADPISNFTCVPDKTPRDPNDLLAAYNVFRGRYITPVPGSTAIHKAEWSTAACLSRGRDIAAWFPELGPGSITPTC
jgi:hypothetical protein